VAGACRRHFLAHRFIAGAHHVLHDLPGIAGEFTAQCGIHQLTRSLAAGNAVSLSAVACCTRDDLCEMLAVFQPFGFGVKPCRRPPVSRRAVCR
jgi:hypothetical protein